MEPSFQALLRESPGQVPSVAYDTAWAALLGDHAPDLSYPALQWLCSHQLPDGSWGAPFPAYYHDRLISTLMALIAMARCGRRSTDRMQVDAGMAALHNLAEGKMEGLVLEPGGATAGFESLIPFLVNEAELLGLLSEEDKEAILTRSEQDRSHKLERLKGRLVNRQMSLAFSAEMAGWENWESLLDGHNLAEPDGSVAHSPATTAYYAWAVQPGDRRALDYLRRAVLPDHGFPIAFPFEIYEITWVLWNLNLVPGAADLPEYQSHLAALRQAWRPGQGIGFTASHPIPDGDDTALVATLLAAQGEVDRSVFQNYAEKDHFRCFPLEITPSVSTNVHFLHALRASGYALEDSYVQRIVRFMEKTRTEGGHWKDKWHISPYYTTAHAIIACAGYCEALVQPAVRWMLARQYPEGGWGAFSKPTAEETAYCLQALAIWRRTHRDDVPAKALQRGSEWLRAHADPPYPLLWLAKSLYVSRWVVRAEIASALALAEEALS